MINNDKYNNISNANIPYVILEQINAFLLTRLFEYLFSKTIMPLRRDLYKYFSHN